MTDAELRKLCEKWQRILRLQDWRIDVRQVGTEELDDKGQGQCEPHADTKTATIKILEPAAFNQTSRHAQAFPEGLDPEITLVHELVHIHFDGLFVEEDNELRERMEEQAIEFVAQALVAVERDGKT